jgi:hypothetical protein
VTAMSMTKQEVTKNLRYRFIFDSFAFLTDATAATPHENFTPAAVGLSVTCAAGASDGDKLEKGRTPGMIPLACRYDNQ